MRLSVGNPYLYSQDGFLAGAGVGEQKLALGTL